MYAKSMLALFGKGCLLVEVFRIFHQLANLPDYLLSSVIVDHPFGIDEPWCLILPPSNDFIM